MDYYEVDAEEYEAFLKWKTDGKARLLETISTMDRDTGNEYLDALTDQGPLFTDKMPT
jgi:hypothetical protein